MPYELFFYECKETESKEKPGTDCYEEKQGIDCYEEKQADCGGEAPSIEAATAWLQQVPLSARMLSKLLLAMLVSALEALGWI